MPAAQRQRNPRLKRTEVYRGDEFEFVVNLAADPEARFVMVVGSNGSLYTVPVDGSSGITPLFTLEDIPALAGKEFPLRYQHAVLGRVWQLRTLATPAPSGEALPVDTVLLVDQDNDAVFDYWLVEDYSVAKEQFFADEQILDYFHYPNPWPE